MRDDHTDALIQSWLDGSLDDRSFAELEAVLAASPAARQQFWAEVQFHGELHEAFKLRCSHLAAVVPAAEQPAPATAVRGRARSTGGGWGRRTRWLAAAATLMLGGCGVGSVATSLSLAYAGWAPAAKQPVVVIHEGFEAPPAPRADFVPRQPGFWSGDVTEVVGAEQQITPKAGRSMLRFVSTSPADESPAFNVASELWRLVDLDEVRQQLGADHSPVDLELRLTATFNGVPPSAGRQPKCGLKMIATDAASPAAHAIWLQSGLTNAQSDNPAATYVMGEQQLFFDPDPGSWQRLTVQLHAPATARYLMLYCHVHDSSDAARDTSVRFEGQYVDEIELTAQPASP